MCILPELSSGNNAVSDTLAGREKLLGFFISNERGMSMKKFSGTVKVKVKKGMKVRINPKEVVGKMHLGKEFIIDSEPRVLCATEVVALNNLDGSRFSAAYDLSMLEVTDTNSEF